MEKKKILFTLVDLNIGGVQKTLIDILNNIDYKRYKVDLMVLKEQCDLIDLLPKEVNILYARDYVNISSKKSIINRLNKNVNIKGIIKKYKNKFNLNYDVAIAFNGFNNYADLIVQSVNAKKRVIWVHNDFYSVIKNSKHKFLYGAMYKKMGDKFKYFDTVAVVNEVVAEKFNVLYKNKYKDKVKIVSVYFDENDILKKSKDTSDITLSNKFNIISVGRLCKAKNFALLVRLHKKLIENNYDVNTYIIGDGEYRESLERLIKENNLEESFTLLGKRTNPYCIVKNADLYVSTSLYEAFANTLMESLVLGVPIVATDTSGARNVVKNIAKENTCLIGESEEELYNLIVKSINNKPKIEPLNLEDYNKKVMKSIYELLS